MPEHLRGQPVCGIVGMYVGGPEHAAAAFQPLKEAEPHLDLIQPMPYTDFQAILDPGNQPGFRNYWRGEYMAGLHDDAIDTFVTHAREPLSPFNQMVVFRLGGGVTRIADDETAFSHRDAEFMFHPIAMWEDPADDEQQIEGVRHFHDAMRPFATGGVYLNFTADRDKVRDAYASEKYERLVALKDKYDPENLFQHNQNIQPSGKSGEPALA